MAFMQRPQLISSALTVLVLGLGATAEVLAPSSSSLLTVTDSLVGTEFAVAGAILLSRVPRLGALSLAVAASWFLGTLAGAGAGPLGETGSLFLLAYRGALLQVLLSAPSGLLGRWQARLIAITSWVVAFLPVSVGRPGTVLAAATVALAIAYGAGRTLGTQRGPAFARAGSCMVLTAVWGLGLVGGVSAWPYCSWTTWPWPEPGSPACLSRPFGRVRRPPWWSSCDLASHAGQPVVAGWRASWRTLASRSITRSPGLVGLTNKGIPAPRGMRTGASSLVRALPPAARWRWSTDEVLLPMPASPKRPQRQQRWSWTRHAWKRTCAVAREEVRASRRRLLGAADAERRSLEGRLSVEVLSKLRSVGGDPGGARRPGGGLFRAPGRHGRGGSPGPRSLPARARPS